jgi:hypothetical protein
MYVCVYIYIYIYILYLSGISGVGGDGTLSIEACLDPLTRGCLLYRSIELSRLGGLL